MNPGQIPHSSPLLKRPFWLWPCPASAAWAPAIAMCRACCPSAATARAPGASGPESVQPGQSGRPVLGPPRPRYARYTGHGASPICLAGSLRAWNESWNDMRARAWEMRNFRTFAGDIGAGRSPGAPGQASCKRQVSGSNPPTGSSQVNRLSGIRDLVRGIKCGIKWRLRAPRWRAQAPERSHRATAERVAASQRLCVDRPDYLAPRVLQVRRQRPSRDRARQTRAEVSDARRPKSSVTVAELIRRIRRIADPLSISPAVTTYFVLRHSSPGSYLPWLP